MRKIEPTIVKIERADQVSRKIIEQESEAQQKKTARLRALRFARTDAATAETAADSQK
jgi:hypothetical protein